MERRNLRLVIVEAKELKANDGNSSDPYTVVKCLGQTYKTEVIKKSLAPVWNHIVELQSVDDQTLIEIEIYDKERFGADKVLGSVQVPVSLLKNNVLQGSRDQWLSLTKKGFVRVSFDFNPPYTTVGGVAPQVIQASPQLAAVQQTVNALQGFGLPPPVYFAPQYVSCYPLETKLSFSPYGEIYTARTYITGQPLDMSLLYSVSQPFIVIRSLRVQFKGKISYRGKTIRSLFYDSRNLLQLVPDKKVRLECGKHIFPFQFFIPKECQSSTHINDFKVEYSLFATADVVNLPDQALNATVNVVNIEDTIFKITNIPLNVTASKSPLSGGSIEMTIKSAKNSYVRGEDIEMEVTVNNNSKKTIKKIDFDLYRNEDRHDQPKSIVKVASSKKYFLPKINKGSQGTHSFVFELPHDLPTSTYYPKAIKVEYVLHAILDIPNCVDLITKVPISIVYSDPNIQYRPDPLSEIASIPLYINKFTDRHVYSYFLLRHNAPAVADEFDRLNTNGLDLLNYTEETLRKCLALAPPDQAETLYQTIKNEIYKVGGVRTLLKSLQTSSPDQNV
ncbi:SAM domain-containing protein [Cavenderia fasciculata]|uniref:SAM domain-containing protein n=1 Tax=Cavenderia fasciculata TaxID=261658 RepID=F4PLJ0_CACFS|nr:SAM domain-containing protein [Cavenderia fasciculata]EGG23412.1 SAM domain-containing protein [Cavenderia fasciculata]|eukprot:XP_004361263.1 SAM domain-containing protein [Cavenderia fasciculata]